MAQAGPETLTFREFATQQYIKRSGYKEPPTGLGLAFVSHGDYASEPRKATLHANYLPAMYGHGPGFSDELWRVDGVGFWRIQPSKHTAVDLYVRSFPVYDFDVDKVADPTVVDPIKEIEAQNVVVINTSPYERRENGIVVDSLVKSRILEWHQAFCERGLKNDVKKFVQLRRAPFMQSNVPGFGKYTYQGVLNEAFAKSKMGSLGWSEVTFRMFQAEDVEWLQTFMHNQGLETPEIEQLPHFRLD